MSLFFKKKLVFFGVIVIPLTSVGAGMSVYIDNDVVNIAQKPIVANETVINLDEQIKVYFTMPIDNTKEYEKAVISFPQTTLNFEWNDNNTAINITPKTIWKPKTEYSIAFPYNSYDFEKKQSTIFSFETVAYPKVIDKNIDSFVNNYIKEGEEIVIKFDKNIDDFDIDAVIRPVIDVTKKIDKNNKTLSIQINKIDQGDKGFHTITIFAKHKNQARAQFYPVSSMSFNVLVDKPEIWPQEHADRLAAARLSTIPKKMNGKYIDINLDAQITTLFDNGKFIKNFVSSSGANETPTPTGEFHIYNKHPYALSGMFNVYLPYWMAFTEDGKYGLHGLVVWPEGQSEKPAGTKESEENIGNAVSAGCVRHDDENAEFLYNWTDIGTIVYIY